MRWRLALVCFLLLSFPLVASGANFSDVQEIHKHALAIQYLKENQLVSGYPDGTFKPDQILSRAEAIAMILKTAGIIVQKSAIKIPFIDVPEDAWFFPMIQKGVEVKKLKGFEDKTFRPHHPVTIPEAIALTLSFFNIETKTIKLDLFIYDGLDRNAWYAKRMQYAKNNNLIEPNVDGYIDPVSPMTRGQLAEIMYRIRMVYQSGKPFDITRGWVMTEYLENFWKIKHPPDWEIFKGQKNSVIWKRDSNLGTSTHVFFTKVWPASSRLSISLVENPQNFTAPQYFSRLREIYKKNYPHLIIYFSELTLSGKNAFQISIPERHLIDTAISLPNKNFLLLYGEYGESSFGEFLKKHLEAIVQSYQYVEKLVEPPKPVLPLADRMEMLREKILESNQWKEIQKLFPDKKLIYTDGIGIGTGPVDYYYSKEADHTIKVERKTGTILNIREEETKGF